MGTCLDLLEPQNAENVRKSYKQLKRETEAAGGRLPRNFNAKKPLDCAVFQYTAALWEGAGQPLDHDQGSLRSHELKRPALGTKLAVSRGAHPVVRSQSGSYPGRVAAEAGEPMTALPTQPTSLSLTDVLARKRTPRERALALAKAGIIKKTEVKRVEIRLRKKSR